MKKILLKRINPDNPDIKSYATAIRKGEKCHHVMPSEKGWVVKKLNASRASAQFQTQKEAIDYARRKALKHKTEFFVHGKDGRIRDRRFPRV